MKKIVLLTTILLSITTLKVTAQEKGDPFPVKTVYTLEGEEVSTADIVNHNGHPVVIDFWATWCKPCLLSIKFMHSQYEEWKKNTNVKIVLISIDDEKMIGKIKHMAEAKEWDFDLYIDKSGELQKSLKFNQIPQTFLIDKFGKIAWHEDFAPGDEKRLYKNIKKYVK